MSKNISVILLLATFLSCSPEKYDGLDNGLYAEIQTNKGNILVELYAEDVPMTVANFVSLAEGDNTKVTDSLRGKNFYDDLIFHRVVKNFVIQGGDPTGTGRGNPGYRFGDEFPENEEGELLYKHDDEGILSMANSGPETNGCQIFITHRPIPSLNGKHSVFGKTIINSEQLELLQSKYSNSEQLAQAIDSTRMAVVNKIEVKDTIFHVEIIRKGAFAKAFDSGDVFNDALSKYASKADERKAEEAESEAKRYSEYLENKKEFLDKMNESEATKYDNGVRVLKLKTNPSGTKVPIDKPFKSHYTLFIADGTEVQSTYESEQPFVCRLNDEERPMITGFKEGVSKLRVGEKARIFIPYTLGFGADKYGPFPAKSDLMFEIEILEIEN